MGGPRHRGGGAGSAAAGRGLKTTGGANSSRTTAKSTHARQFASTMQAKLADLVGHLRGVGVDVKRQQQLAGHGQHQQHALQQPHPQGGRSGS